MIFLLIILQDKTKSLMTSKWYLIKEGNTAIQW